MFRALLATSLAITIVLAAGLSPSTAQEQKSQPKKKVRIAIAEPKDAAKDPDFAIQGEYEGSVKIGKTIEKFGAQVVAKGEGVFAVKILKDGLPGAGWDGKKTIQFTADRVDGKVVVKMDGREIGTIGGGTMVLKPTEETAILKRVERKSKTLGAKSPQNAVVLFGTEGDEKNWAGGKLVTLSDGKFLDVGVRSKEKFGPFKAAH